MDEETEQEGTLNLLEAARTGAADKLMRALAAGADPDTEDERGDPALVLAVEMRSESCVKALLKAGASVNAESCKGETVLIAALRLGSVPVVKLLLAAGADPDAESQSGVRAVVLAARLGLKDSVELLLKSGADPNSEDERGNTMLINAARAGDALSVRHLVAKGADPDASDSSGAPALAVAISRGCVDVVAELVKSGADLDATNEHGDPMLAQAIRRADAPGLEILGLLLTGGADPSATSAEGARMAAVAYRAGGARGASMLAALAKAAGGEMEWSDTRGIALLARAIEDRRFDWVEELAAAGADVYAENEKGENCMHMAMKDRRSMAALQDGFDRKEGRSASRKDEDEYKNKVEDENKMCVSEQDEASMKVDDLKGENLEGKADKSGEADDTHLTAIFQRVRLARAALARGVEALAPRGATEDEDGNVTETEGVNEVPSRSVSFQAKESGIPVAFNESLNPSKFWAKREDPSKFWAKREEAETRVQHEKMQAMMKMEAMRSKQEMQAMQEIKAMQEMQAMKGMKALQEGQVRLEEQAALKEQTLLDMLKMQAGNNEEVKGLNDLMKTKKPSKQCTTEEEKPQAPVHGSSLVIDKVLPSVDLPRKHRF